MASKPIAISLDFRGNGIENIGGIKARDNASPTKAFATDGSVIEVEGREELTAPAASATLDLTRKTANQRIVLTAQDGVYPITLPSCLLDGQTVTIIRLWDACTVTVTSDNSAIYATEGSGRVSGCEKGSGNSYTMTYSRLELTYVQSANMWAGTDY